MERELTSHQARLIAGLRLRHPGADLVVHPRPWGLIVEARDERRTLELGRVDWSGGTAPDVRIAPGP